MEAPSFDNLEYTASELDKLPLNELQDIATYYRLDSTGTKERLISSILAFQTFIASIASNISDKPDVSNKITQLKTIKRITATPKIKRKVRGKEVLIHNPVVGNIVTKIDSGYAPDIGSVKSYVVVDVKTNKDGDAKEISISPIVSVTDDTVTYKVVTNTTLKPYSNKHGNFWNTTADHHLYLYFFDDYRETVEGDYNK
jgi:hypothetical protein